MVFKKCSLLLVLVSVTSIYCSPTIPEDTFSGMKAISSLYDDCVSKDIAISSCLKLKALSLIDRVARSDKISFNENIIISKNDDAKNNREDYGRAINEIELENEIKNEGQQQNGEQDNKLNGLILDRVAKFMSTHNINIKLPTISKDDLARSLGEMRGKKNKDMGMIMMAIGMKLMMLIPLAIGALFLLAGKALIISKIALVLALIITIKKLLASKQESHGWSSGGGGGHGGWDRRSLDTQEAAQDMAYNAYKQE